MNRGDEAEVRVLMKHPFFDIDSVFDFSLSDVKKLVGRIFENPSQELRDYVEAEHKQREKFHLNAILNESKTSSEFDVEFDKWIEISGFLLSTNNVIAFERLLGSYVEGTTRLATLAFASRDSNSTESFCISCLHQFLAVAVKAHKTCDEKVVEEVFNGFEQLVDEIIVSDPNQLRVADCTGAFIRVVTGLLAALMVTSALVGGTNAATFNRTLKLPDSFGGSVWGNVRFEDRFRFALCCLHFALAIYGDQRPLESREGFSNNSLLRLRRVLVDGMNSLPQPTTAIYSSVFRYFIDQIDQGVSYRSTEFRLIQENFTDADRYEIMRLADKFRVYHRGVTFERLVSYLGQFKTLRMIRAALVLLRNVKFYTSATLQTMLEGVFRELPNGHEAHTVVTLGTPGGSTSLMQYLVSHWTLGELRIENDLERVLESTPVDTPLYFIDDCTLSGTQTINTFAEYLGKRDLKPHHTVHCQPLKIPDALLRRPLVLIYAIGSFVACQRLRNGLARLGLENVTIKAAACEDTRLKPFSASMEHIWDEPGQRELLRDFLSDVGFSILEPRSVEKAWKDGLRNESSLGFSDFQRLIVFQYNVPKTTIAPLWEAGPFQGKEWMPLFPVSD